MSARIRFKPRITKKNMFFLPSARIGFMPISEEKQLVSGDKKKMPKKNKFISGDKKYFSSYVFCLFFRRPHYLFLIDQKFFYLVALISFFRILYNVFFILSPSSTVQKTVQCFFFLKYFFSPSLIKFWIFSDLKQKNKT